MPSVKRQLGYGGSASIASTQVLITGGSFEQASAISYLSMISTPPDVTPAGRVQHADGVNSYTGSLAFDVHEEAMSIFSPGGGLLQRFYEFDIGINSGGIDASGIAYDWKMSKCKLTSLTLAGAVGGLVTANLSYLALSGRAIGSTSNNFIRDSVTPLGYWYTGTGSSDDVKNWNLTMNQEAELVYKNSDSVEPAYIKVGAVSYVLTVTSFKDLFPADDTQQIVIATDTFTLKGKSTSRGFSFGGVTDVGTYSYTFETSSQTGASDAVVIT